MKFSKSCVLMCPWANHDTNPLGFLWAVWALTPGVAHWKCYSQAVVLKVLVLRQRASAISVRLWEMPVPRPAWELLTEKLWEEYPAPCIWEALQVILMHAQIWELLWGSTLRGTLWHRRPADTTNFRTLCPLSSTKWQNVSEISIFQHQNSISQVPWSAQKSFVRSIFHSDGNVPVLSSTEVTVTCDYWVTETWLVWMTECLFYLILTNLNSHRRL